MTNAELKAAREALNSPVVAGSVLAFLGRELLAEIDARAARIQQLEAALREGLDHMHPITCASMDGFEASGKPCDCWHSHAEAALAPTQRPTWAM